MKPRYERLNRADHRPVLVVGSQQTAVQALVDVLRSVGWHAQASNIDDAGDVITAGCGSSTVVMLDPEGAAEVRAADRPADGSTDSAWLLSERHGVVAVNTVDDLMMRLHAASARRATRCSR